MTTNFETLPLMLSVKQLAQVMGLSLPLAYDLAKREDFPAVKVSERRIVIPKDALQRWIEQQTERSA